MGDHRRRQRHHFKYNLRFEIKRWTYFSVKYRLLVGHAHLQMRQWNVGR